jgi:endoglucanase
MDERTRDFLDRLLDAPGPSGYEGEAARSWREEAETFAESVWSDVQGNSFAEIAPEGSPRVMLAGHVDEIGLMVNHVDDDGYLYVQSVGGWDPQVLVGQRVEVLGGDGVVPGVIGRRAIHLIDRDERDKAVKIKDLWIDIGASDAEEARERVGVGDVAVIRSDVLDLENGRVAARSIDDRIGAVVVLEALRRAAEKGASANGVAVATTQEEIGYKSGGGARTSTFGLEPDAAVVVDVTHATDHPSVSKKEHGEIELGGGPVLSRGAVVNPVLYRRLVEVAEESEIPYQVLAAPSSTGTDADSIYTSRTGVATAVVSVPNRYMHSPNQMVSGDDVEHAAELIAALLVGLDPGTSFLPG